MAPNDSLSSLDQLFEQGFRDQRVLPSATPMATKPAASNPADGSQRRRVASITPAALAERPVAIPACLTIWSASAGCGRVQPGSI